MPNPLAIDAHAHICTEETMKLLEKETPKVAPKLKRIREGRVRVDRRRRAVPAFSARRLRHGAAAEGHEGAEVDMQVLSVTPQTFLYGQDAGARRPLVAHPERPDRQARQRLARPLPRHRHLPMQAPKAAADELRRAMASSGSRARRSAPTSWARTSTIRRSSRCGRPRTSSPRSCMVHPNNVAGADRLKCLLSRQPDRQPARHHDRGRLPGVRRRDRALSGYPVLHGAWRRLHALPGRPLAAWLARAAGAEEPSQEAARGDSSARSISTPSCTASRRWNSWCRRSAPTTSCSAATIPYDMGTFECARQVKALSIPDADKAVILGGLVQKLLAGAK